MVPLDLAAEPPCDAAPSPRRLRRARSALEPMIGAAARACAGIDDPGGGARGSSRRRSTTCTTRIRLAGMREAVERLEAAVARRERIAVHGDYDVDGITLDRHPAPLRSRCSAADVVHFIPERLKDGYGLQPATIERLHAEGVARRRVGRLRHPRRRRRRAARASSGST